MDRIEIVKDDVVEWLRESDFYKDMDEDDVYSIERTFYKETDEVEDIEDIKSLINAARWWGVNIDDVAQILIKFINGDSSVYLKILSLLLSTDDDFTIELAYELKDMYDEQHIEINGSIKFNNRTDVVSCRHLIMLNFQYRNLILEFNLKFTEFNDKLIYPFHLTYVLLMKRNLLKTLSSEKRKNFINKTKAFNRFQGLKDIELNNGKINKEVYSNEILNYKYNNLLSQDFLDMGTLLMSYSSDGIYKLPITYSNCSPIFSSIITSYIEYNNYDNTLTLCKVLSDKNGKYIDDKIIIKIDSYKKTANEFENLYIHLTNTYS
jgi:hypothetical protein